MNGTKPVSSMCGWLSAVCPGKKTVVGVTVITALALTILGFKVRSQFDGIADFVDLNGAV